MRAFPIALVPVLLAPIASAQNLPTRAFERIPGPVRDGGVYHLATGTWTRGGAQALVAAPGADIVYNNTVPSGYTATPLAGETWTMSGRLPSTSSPALVWNPLSAPLGFQNGSAVGCADSYTIDGFQIGYCSRVAGPNVQASIAFHQSWLPLCSPLAGSPTGGPFALTGLPGRGIGAIACWTITIDLTASTSSFTMLADGDGVYGMGTDDGFAWSIAFPSTTGPADETRLFVAGCPSDASGPGHPGIGWPSGSPATTVEAAGYDGTRFDGPPGAIAPVWPANGAVGLPTPAGEDGTDPLGDDAFRTDGGGIYDGCHFLGGPVGGTTSGPYANMHMELYTQSGCVPPTPQPGVPYCTGDGLDPLVTIACPCFNFGAAGNGCASSFNSNGAHLTAAFAPVPGGVQLQGSRMNATGNCIFLKGNANNPGGLPFGDGIFCLTGSLVRLRTKPLVGGAAALPDALDPPTFTLSGAGGTPVGSGLTAYYGVYYRNAAVAFCPPHTFNISNGYQITW